MGHRRHHRHRGAGLQDQQGRAVGARQLGAPAVEVAASAARQVPWRGRPGAALPPALRRPHHDRRHPPHLRGAQQGRRRHPPGHAQCGLSRSRDADAAPDSRWRGGQALRDPPQCAGHADVPAHRARALPQAPDRRRLRARVRNQPQLPQRGGEPAPQPRVHHDGVLRRVRRLSLADGLHRGPDPPGRDRGHRQRRAQLPGPRAGPVPAVRPPDDLRSHPEVRRGLYPGAARRPRVRARRAQETGSQRRGSAAGARRPGRAATGAVRGNRRSQAVAPHLHHRLPGRGLAPGARLRHPRRHYRALRTVHHRTRNRQRLLRAQRP
ncbi:Uncharacterised protein [Bordetella pertussis]|nr:Uncharacterised protein [Bordetella pertussis]CFW14117.1 Uncharacterised protein [Bordetella pertussis]CFW92004.1 Uncharacterised protein [Bordetella pertussis]CPJ13038.1 Uncharacterised protein [Bordetella pertussis]CPL62226.1 Uncharacterised protein [Bordetella pertussis]